MKGTEQIVTIGMRGDRVHQVEQFVGKRVTGDKFTDKIGVFFFFRRFFS